MVTIPKRLQNPEFRFVLIKPRLKAPFEYNWQKKNNYRFDKIPKHKGNLGIVAGYGGLIVLDIDTYNLIEQFDKIGTFSVETGTRKRHYYFICNEKFQRKYYVLGRDAGELRVSNSQVVIPDSIHPNGRKYQVYNDVPIKKITKKEIKVVLGDLLNKEDNVSDVTRSGEEWREVCGMVEGGYNFEEVDREMRLLGFTKWKESVQAYRLHTYIEAVRNVFRKQKV